MKGDKTIIGIVAGLLIALLVISGCSTQAGKIVQDKDKIVKIGIIAPLTGEASLFGEALTNAAKIVQKEYSNQSTYFNYKFIIEDDQLENAKTVTAFHKLNDIDGINALLSFSSGSGHAIAPLAEQSKIVMCSAGTSDINVVKGRTYVFKHWVTPEAEAAKYVEEAKLRGFKTIGVIAANQQGIVAAINEVKKVAQSMVVFEEIVEPTTKDFRTIILKAQNNKPDTLLIWLFPGQLTVFMQQAEELGYKGNISSIESFEFEKEAVPYLEGKWYVSSAEEKGVFKDEYQAEFNSKPLITSGNAYDCLKLFILAYEKAKTTNPDDIVAELHKVKDYQGAMGTLYIDSNNSIQSEAAVKEIRNGTFVVVRE